MWVARYWIEAVCDEVQFEKARSVVANPADVDPMIPGEMQVADFSAWTWRGIARNEEGLSQSNTDRGRRLRSIVMGRVNFSPIAVGSVVDSSFIAGRPQRHEPDKDAHDSDHDSKKDVLMRAVDGDHAIWTLRRTADGRRHA